MVPFSLREAVTSLSVPRPSRKVHLISILKELATTVFRFMLTALTDLQYAKYAQYLFGVYVDTGQFQLQYPSTKMLVKVYNHCILQKRY